MSESLSLAHVKAHLSEVLDRVLESHDRVTITRHGRPEAVVMAIEDLAALEETLELLSTPGALAEIEEGRAAAARGDGLSADDLRGRYLSDRR